MSSEFQRVIYHLIEDHAGSTSGGLTISEQFRPDAADDPTTFRKLNAAFLILLAGEAHSDHEKAGEFLKVLADDPSWKEAVYCYQEALGLVPAEIKKRVSTDSGFADTLTDLSSWLKAGGKNSPGETDKNVEKFWGFFFPEGVPEMEDRTAQVERLRELRKIRITRLNPEPITRPAEEVLFTSNILLTVPSPSKPIENLPLGKKIRESLKNTTGEDQRYWYDHPIQVGVEPEHNEALYGLKGLSDALQFEKDRGVVEEDSRLACVLSVSVTHEGLQSIARDYLEEILHADGGIRNIDAYVFTEIEAGRLIDEVFSPAVEKYIKGKNPGILKEIFGTDGEYGRHYTFLKAIAAVWQVLINPKIKGTFKFDLDQVFPQKELVEQTGFSAFEHFMTPLWGAEGVDHKGQEVDLGMLAGALVNQRDIHRGLFTPDVTFPSGISHADERVFFSKLPQALSTEAEMMTRYGDGGLDGKTACIQRIHVTGGTNGILIRALRKHRPFTPIFIGRAEDQAYLLSVLLPESGRALRYVHKDGLIMRHDKEAMAAGAIKAAALGKLIGDYVRILTFSSYARALPWSFEEIKSTVDPFTGCFISRIPITLVYLRCALKAASFFAEETEESNLEGAEFLRMAVGRLHRAVRDDIGEPNPLIEIYRREKEAWNLFFDLLDKFERDLKKNDPFIFKLREKARAIVEECKIKIG